MPENASPDHWMLEAEAWSHSAASTWSARRRRYQAPLWRLGRGTKYELLQPQHYNRARERNRFEGEDYVSILELALFSEDVGAARASDKEEFKLKLKHASHIDRHSSSRMAAEFGQLDLVDNLLQNNTLDVNAATNKTGDTALHYALKTDCSEVVTFLLERGAHRDSRDSEGRTALGLSFYTTETHCLSILL